MQTLCIATGNKGKQIELAALLAEMPFEVKTLRDFFDPLPVIPETGATFLENAFIKAQWVFDKLGILVLADDSGLVVDALGQEPGVFSARYAGEGATDADNNLKLLSALQHVALANRGAQFVCSLACIMPQGKRLTAQGICRGNIITEPSGSLGFGYDPLFIPEGYTKTFAELSTEVKNTISHRCKAFAHMVELLKESNEFGLFKEKS